ncbi:predicted protein [Nematostella vectensis]|uniref:RING finger and CHY zinc finger domain-containing protein 1 n=1 Tax=Nematostella vectensis TaxID=45351 RepID=A7T0F1_NEMVE|nr:predicted protein [Nematostella vectensis]|eukprot:XP_001622661.1 predicted protein [Nematostella vectensis]
MASASGCEHYTRRCAFVTPCCNNIYACRICHDEKENHQLDRKSVQSVKCLQCNNIQDVASSCEECETKFGRYFCEICRLFDDQEKGQFHCDACGICRIGGRKNFYHCPRCDICLGVGLKDSHKCVDKSARNDCPVCLEDIHTSRISANMSPCGHMIHSTCMSKLLASGLYMCPLCKGSMVNMSSMWKQMDREIGRTPMPEEYHNVKVTVLCCDCHKKSKVKFHVLGAKCSHCGSYNTSREGIEGLPEDLAGGATGGGETEIEDAAMDEGDPDGGSIEHQVRLVQRAVENVSASVADIRLEVDEGIPPNDLPLD